MNVRRRLLSSTLILSCRFSRLIQAFIPSTRTTVSRTRTMSISASRASSTTPRLVSPVEKEGRVVPVQSTSAFLITVALTPVWAATILPLSVLYQLGKAAINPLLPSAAPGGGQKLDTGYVVDASTKIVPRSQRKYDIVVLGATGFTGKLAARHLAKTYGVGKSVSWAIAGRSEAKLEQIKKELADQLGMEEILKVDTIIVDTSVPATLPNLVEQTRVVATTAGPYSLMGSSVVEFCSKFGTHYVDITGEVGWVKTMAVLWQDTAEKTGAKFISFCGHDSVPWDLSVMKMQEVLRSECQDDLKTVTFWNEAVADAPGGTFATVMAAAEGKEPNPPRKEIDPFLRMPDGSKSMYLVKPQLPSFIEKAESPWDSQSSKRWTMPFIMAGVNSQVVKWSYALRAEGSKSLVYKESLVMPDFKSAFVSFVGLVMGGSMFFNPLTRSLLKKYVITKPGDGPSMNKMEKTNYLCVLGEGIGVNGNRVESVMYFPKDPGCLETSRMLIEAGLTLALQDDKLANNGGGFWTPSTALGEIYMQRLLDTGTTFTYRVVPKDEVRSKM